MAGHGREVVAGRPRGPGLDRKLPPALGGAHPRIRPNRPGPGARRAGPAAGDRDPALDRRSPRLL